MEPLTDYRLAVARAIVARCVQKGREGAAATASAVMLDGQCRDRIVELLVAALGGREASVADWVKEKAGRLVMAGGTRYFRRARGRLSDQFAPLGADVIAYQARPRPLREFIRDCVRKASAAAHARGESGDVAVIAHSLGGVATVDALIEQPLPAVSDLMTIGSQAPLLYELDALGSLPILRDVHGKVAPPPHPLPPHFPKAWLNVYDPRDFLSYRAAGVFGASCVQDEEIDTGQPFPESHSAYWTNDRVWDVIVDRLS
jgi:hypothetical protein